LDVLKLQVSNCLGYEDRIEDGFYEVWGMSPYVWSMCTDSNELGRMPPLESLRSVDPAEAEFEVVLVDRNGDPHLRELEDKAVGFAYDSQEVLDLATKLAQMVAAQMGGPAGSDEVLAETWRASTTKLTRLLGSLVLPIGLLKCGLGRHRALLFKVNFYYFC
jgi:serine/threonine-protein kinase CTR1